MRLQTPVTDLPCKVGISYDDSIMMLGSCFSDNIGRQLEELGFNVCINPFGTLYNPASILGSIERLASGKEFTEKDCIRIGAGDERWCSFFHHTSFARDTKEEFLDNANKVLRAACTKFEESGKVIITLGTSWCFRHIEKDFIVSNCLKRPACEFVRERLSAAEVTSILRRIGEICQGKQIIFTVSPIRHFKDGAHCNQLSKAALLLGIDDYMCGCPADLSMHPHYTADYFPAYEIVMDELRDYRFYAEDMCHPSAQTVSYLCERFLSWGLSAAEQHLLEERIRQRKQQNHRK